MATKQGGASRFVLILTGCIIVLLLAVAWIVRWFVIETPATAAERAVGIAREVGADIRDAMQFEPTVLVNNQTVVQQDASVAKLVTVERPITERHSYEHRWLGSTKRIVVEGDFTLRAGFDLAKPFVIRVDPETGGVEATLPPAEIVGIDSTDLRILVDDDGWINQLTKEDREAAIETLRDRAMLHATDSDLLKEARIAAEARLESVLASEGRQLSFDPAPTPLP